MFSAILEQLSQYPRGNNAIPPVRITGVPKSGLLVVLGGAGGVFGLSLGSLGGLSGPLWAPLGLSWAPLGVLWGPFGPP